MHDTMPPKSQRLRCAVSPQCAFSVGAAVVGYHFLFESVCDTDIEQNTVSEIQHKTICNW